MKNKLVIGVTVGAVLLAGCGSVVYKEQAYIEKQLREKYGYYDTNCITAGVAPDHQVISFNIITAPQKVFCPKDHPMMKRKQ